MFAWIQRQVYAAFVGGAHNALADMGLIESDATAPADQAAAVRAVMATDKPTKKREK